MRANPATGRRSAPDTGGVSLTENTQQIVLGWIRAGKYPAGSQLPSVPDLVVQLKVSRTVVREALQSLGGMNLIEMRPGLGCFVKTIPSALLINADVLASLLSREAMVDVVAARKVIEGGIARLAAVTSTEEDFAEMEEVLRKIEREAKKNQPMYEVTPLFHIALARGTHNKVLVKIVESFSLLMASAGALIERQNVGYQYRTSQYESHKQLYEVLRRRDANRMQHAMEDHIEETAEALQAIPE